MTAVAVLTEALARGGRVVWEPTEKPRLLAPPSLHPKIKADRETVKEILRRAAEFRRQAQTPGPIPFLHLPGCLEGDGLCLSCGTKVDLGHFRCPACTLAVNIALEG